MFESIDGSSKSSGAAAGIAAGWTGGRGSTSGVIEMSANAGDLLGRFEAAEGESGSAWDQTGWNPDEGGQRECAQLDRQQLGWKKDESALRSLEGVAYPGRVSVENVRTFSAALADADTCETTDSHLIDLMRALEELKSAAAAVQAGAAAVFDASQRRAQARAGVPAGQLGRGVGAQVALARRDSPHRGSRHLGFGKALVHEMPHTLKALSLGVLSEWRATLLVRETACLDVQDRHRVDELICADPSSLEGVGDRKLIARIRSVTQGIDPASQVRRNAKAVADRYVSCRPAPDTMSYLTGLLPVAQGVAVYAALSRAADSLRATGDERGRGQIMADTLVERVTGQTTADRVPVEVQLVITDRTLLSEILIRQSQAPHDQGSEPRAPHSAADDPADGAGNVPAGTPGPRRREAPDRGQDTTQLDTLPESPAYFPGYGIVPGAWARQLIRSALGTSNRREAPPLTESRASSPPDADRQVARPPDSGRQTSEHAGRETPLGEASLVSLRRLYLDPLSGELTAMESKARAFPAGLARLIRTRDQTCRTPWCDAPIRHIDHVQPHAEGGPTSYTNGQGLCEACNHAKEAPGWNAAPIRTMPGESLASGPGSGPRTSYGTRHTVRVTTPTGHTYTSIAPPLPGTGL
ncbi:HNH endonuclease [Arthrobacter sp. NPDC055585]